MNLDELRASGKAAVTVTDVARLLELDERTVRRACEDQQLPCLHIGRRLLIPREPLLALLTTHTDSESPAPTAELIATTKPAEGAHNHGSQEQLSMA